MPPPDRRLLFLWKCEPVNAPTRRSFDGRKLSHDIGGWPIRYLEFMSLSDRSSMDLLNDCECRRWYEGPQLEERELSILSELGRDCDATIAFQGLRRIANVSALAETVEVCAMHLLLFVNRRF